jgi:hypothetical protein
MSAVYIDRRQVPSTYDVIDAAKTALLQVVAVVVLAVIVWAIFGLLLGISIEVNPRMVRASG